MLSHDTSANIPCIRRLMERVKALEAAELRVRELEAASAAAALSQPEPQMEEALASFSSNETGDHLGTFEADWVTAEAALWAGLGSGSQLQGACVALGHLLGTVEVNRVGAESMQAVWGSACYCNGRLMSMCQKRRLRARRGAVLHRLPPAGGILL